MTNETRYAVELMIRGRVQGVCFRESTRRQAELLGVFGFARNEADGTVTVVAEGDPAAVERLVEWCKTGPPLSRVAGVTRKDIVAHGYPEFRIAHR